MKELPPSESFEQLVKLLEESALFIATESPTNVMYQVHYKRWQDLQNYFFPKDREKER
jgi:hypothetical protein